MSETIRTAGGKTRNKKRRPWKNPTAVDELVKTSERRVWRWVSKRARAGWRTLKRKRGRRAADRRWPVVWRDLGRVPVAGVKSRGVVNVSAQWVRLLAMMEPGRWYGAASLGRTVGRKKPIGQGAQHQLRAMLDKTDNPAWREVRLSGPAFTAMAERGEHIEPKYLWRLNQWAVELRAAVLDNPTCETVDVLALPSAPENMKSRGGRLFQPNHRG